VLADLDERGADVGARHHLARQCARGNASRSFAGGGAAAATIVADAVFDVIGIVCVPGAIALGDLAIILGALVGVLDQHGDRCAGRDHGLAVGIHHHTGEHFDDVIFASLCDETRLAGLALVHPGLDFGMGEAETGRAAVHDATERRTVAFAPGGDAEEVTERIVRHGNAEPFVAE
jgi:hypothetical protein